MYTIVSESAPLTYGSYDAFDMGLPSEKKRGNKVIFLVIALLVLGAGAYFLFAEDSLSMISGGTAEEKIEANGISSSYSTRSGAIQRLSSVVGKKTNTTVGDYTITNGNLIGYAFGWFSFKSRYNPSDAKSVQYVTRTFAKSCSKSALTQGDVLVDADEDFMVVFDSWANSDKSKYNLYYVSPSDGEVVYITFDYPYITNNETGKLYRNPKPYCIKDMWFNEDSSDDDSTDNDNSSSGGSTTTTQNGPCSLTDTTCWDKEVSNHNWSSNSLVDHFSLSEFTNVNSNATSTAAYKRVLLQFAYEIEAFWQFWNGSNDGGKTRNSYWFANTNWGGYNGSSTTGINIKSFDPVAKTISLVPSGGRYFYFATTLLDFWKGNVNVESNSVGVKLSLGSGFQIPDEKIEARNDSTYTGSIGSVSNYFTCPMNHYGCWKQAAKTIDWTNTSSKLAKSFALYEFTGKGLSHSSVKSNTELQARVVRFVSQLQRAKNTICDVHGCSVNIRSCNFTASTPWVYCSATSNPGQNLYGEELRRHMPRADIFDWSAPKVYLPNLAPEYGFRGYSTTYSASPGMTPRFNWSGLTNPIPSSNSRSTCPFGDLDHNSKSGHTHAGIDMGDIYNGTNTKIVAAAAGTVLVAGWPNSYGRQVIIQHEVNGQKMLTLYAHLNRYVVSAGDKVSAGQHIGYMGGSGSSSLTDYAAHLHFEICFGEGSTSSSSGRTSYTTSSNCGNPFDFITIKQN